MRSSAIAVSVLAALVVSLALPSQLPAQEWSAEQQEVWQNVETYWDLYTKGDVAAFEGYMHDDFLGWVRGQWVPTNKTDRIVSMKRSIATEETVWYTLKPVGIKVHGDVAIVHYFFTTATRDADGEEQSATGHWTDILMKQGNRWVMIGDAGGTVSEN